MGETSSMTLEELADALADLEGKRTPVGWTPDDAVERATVERIIMERIRAEWGATDERVPCNLDVSIKSKKDSARGLVTWVQKGGIVVEASAPMTVGTHVHVQIRGAASDEHGLHVRGQIAEIDEAGGSIGVSLTEQPSEAHERRLRRFVVEAFKHRV